MLTSLAQTVDNRDHFLAARRNRDKEGFLLLLFVTTVMSITDTLTIYAVPALLVPIIFLRRQDVWMIFIVLSVIFVKIVLSVLLYPSYEYKLYALDYFWIARESATITLFFCWILFGLRVLPLSRLTDMGWLDHLLMITLLLISQVFSLGYPVISTMTNATGLILFLAYILIFSKYQWSAKIIGVLILIGFGLIPRYSTYAVLCCAAMIFLFSLDIVRASKWVVPWRSVTFLGLCVAMVMSLFAYLVHLRPDRDTGEGNNGFVRAMLAQAGYEQIFEEPILGSPMGRGILPLSIVQELGWQQYFEGNEEYNVYALSFHNSFIYLISRFGILSFVLLALVFLKIPKFGQLHAVMFTLLLIVGCAANVVIESLRSGPATAFALGALMSLAEPSLSRSEKKRV